MPKRVRENKKDIKLESNVNALPYVNEPHKDSNAFAVPKLQDAVYSWPLAGVVIPTPEMFAYSGYCSCCPPPAFWNAMQVPNFYGMTAGHLDFQMNPQLPPYNPHTPKKEEGKYIYNLFSIFNCYSKTSTNS